MTKKELAECFDYLDGLRGSGATNMYGAGQYLIRDCGLKRDVAASVLSQWMTTFDAEKSAEDRADEALKAA